VGGGVGGGGGETGGGGAAAPSCSPQAMSAFSTFPPTSRTPNAHPRLFDLKHCLVKVAYEWEGSSRKSRRKYATTQPQNDEFASEFHKSSVD